MIDAERVPVVVATGQSIERDEAVSVIDMAARAGEAALLQAPALRDRIDQVSVVRMMSEVGTAPATELARRLGLTPRRTEVSAIGGNSPQWLVNRAAAAIAAGEGRTVLVVGAEAQRSAGARQQGAAGGDPPPETPDPVVGDDRPGFGPAEMAAGLVAPVQVYAAFESVIAQRAGRTFAEHRGALGELMARFTDIASAHPYAWFRQRRTPAELAEITADNRLVSEPYPKRMCAFFRVDQGAAVIVTSLAEARAAGVEDQAVFCVSGAEAADVWFPTARPDPGTSPAIGGAVAAALEAAAIGLDDVGRLDFYSCFPCAVEMAAEAVGIRLDDPRGLTVTGGLAYFGGPGNNYSLHAIATMVERLRTEGGHGLVTALGWYATKHSVGVYAASPPPSFAMADTTALQRSIDGSAVAVAHEAEGPAVVVACTMSAISDRARHVAPVIARLDDGRHIAAAAAESVDLTELAGHNLVGASITVSGSPPRYRVGE